MRKTSFHRSPLRPGARKIPKLAETEVPDDKAFNSQNLYLEPQGLEIDGELPTVPKDKFKQGVYY